MKSKYRIGEVVIFESNHLDISEINIGIITDAKRLGESNKECSFKYGISTKVDDSNLHYEVSENNIIFVFENEKNVEEIREIIKKHNLEVIEFSQKIKFQFKTKFEKMELEKLKRLKQDLIKLNEKK